MTRLWMIRAGRRGERENDAINLGKALVGFSEVGDLTGCDRQAIFAALQEAYPDTGRKTLLNFTAQLNQLVNRIETGDYVVMPRKSTDVVALGIIKGDYRYEKDELGYHHTRTVEWKREDQPRASFKQDLLYSFGASMTVCEIQRNSAMERVKAVMEIGTDPGPLVSTPQIRDAVIEPFPHTEEEADQADESDFDLKEIASQQVISLIKSEFAGHALAELVDEILRAEGYKTKISPPGPDQGVDILAAGGNLELGGESICVQVKSGDGASNHNTVLRLIGSVANTGASTGLLVSTGGVNVPAQKELDKPNNFFRIRLWQMDDLLRALFRNYDNLSAETRAKLPIERIWAPVQSDSG